jgi:hypothetical protein
MWFRQAPGASYFSPNTFAETEGLATVWGATGEANCLFNDGYYVFFYTCNIGKGWRLPSAPEVTNFIAGWSDPSGSWIGWLNRELGGQLERLNPLSEYAPYGVWTSTGHTVTLPGLFGPTLHVIVGIARNGSEVSTPRTDTSTHRSPFVVRVRTSHYW